MTLRLIIALCVALGVMASYVGGRADGRALCAADHAAAAIAATETVTRAETVRLAFESQRETEARHLEDLAYAEPVAAECGLGADRVRRLNLR